MFLGFTGTYEHTLDTKGRVIVPARFRERLADGLVLAPGQDRCIEIYPVDAFARRVEEWRARPREDRRVRSFLRVLLSGAHEDTLDSQGRVTVPPRLRDYADLDRELVIAGADEHLELWDREAWERYLAEAEPAFAGVDAPLWTAGA